MARCIKDQQLEASRALMDTIYVIGGKWKLPILYSICNGNTRFKDIEQSIPGITNRMLSRNLKELEENQLIIRKFGNDSSVYEYHFTEYSKEYGDLIYQMIKWGKAHKKRIIESIKQPSALQHN
ncbi:winged helix-turn-helix transcriptional regulator [Flavobacterium beibuense]|nr:helix-turn-helix domain-containing protein [Flavobacterium beibuense]